MDPLTHALAGAATAWMVSGRRKALAIGAAAALLPDVDVFIRSASDPLLNIEHHRGFTHSLAFAAVVAVVASRWRTAGIAAAVAYATHGLLDACTTYGTQLFWPFSRYRVGLDFISIIDPLFTLILLIGVVAAFRSRRHVVIAALVLALAWLGLGAIQKTRARDAVTQLAASRGHLIDRFDVFPTFGNTIVWRTIYESNGTLHTDRVRVPWLGGSTHRSTGSVPLVDRADGNARGFERFAWFSDRWVARDPNDPTLIGDARYSLHTDRYEPVWGIRFHGDRTEWVNRTRERRISLRETWSEIVSGMPLCALCPL